MKTLYNTEPNDIPTLLIVEDDISVAEGLSDILTGYQYQVFHTERTADTMDFLEHQKTDLIILDVHLDGENGYELCKKIRELWDIPILYLTGCSSEMELVRGFQSGGDDYMTKPFRMQELIVRIQALLRRFSMQKNHLRKSGNLIYDRERKILKNNHEMKNNRAYTRKKFASTQQNFKIGVLANFFTFWVLSFDAKTIRIEVLYEYDHWENIDDRISTDFR